MLKATSWCFPYIYYSILTEYNDNYIYMEYHYTDSWTTPKATSLDVCACV